MIRNQPDCDCCSRPSIWKIERQDGISFRCRIHQFLSQIDVEQGWSVYLNGDWFEIAKGLSLEDYKQKVQLKKEKLKESHISAEGYL